MISTYYFRLLLVVILTWGGMFSIGNAAPGDITTVVADLPSIYSHYQNDPRSITVDAEGNLVVADVGRIFKVLDDGTITTLASISGSNICLDNAGNIYVSQTEKHLIRKISPDGLVTTVAGSGEFIAGALSAEPSGDHGLATEARLHRPEGIRVDDMGNLYIADTGNHRIRKVSSDGIITTVAGIGYLAGDDGIGVLAERGDGGLATAAQLHSPTDIVLDGMGNLFILDRYSDRIRKVNAAGIISTVAGTGIAGYSGDGGVATAAELSSPNSVDVDAAGNLYIADFGSKRIRKVGTDGVITTVAGMGDAGYLGDNGAATAAQMSPFDISVDSTGNLYVLDIKDRRIRKVATDGTITLVSASRAGFSGDNGAASAAQLHFPFNISMDGIGNLYIADTGNYRVRKVDTDGVISTVVGAGYFGFPSILNGALASDIPLLDYVDIAVDDFGHLHIADGVGSGLVRKVDDSGIVTMVAGGSGGSMYGVDDGALATDIWLRSPTAIHFDDRGNLYIADAGVYRIRKVDSDGIISTVAGSGVGWQSSRDPYAFPGSSADNGDNGLATEAALGMSFGLSSDSLGNLYIADADNHVIRKVDSNGIITTVVGVVDIPEVPDSGSYDLGDNGLAIDAILSEPRGLSVDGEDNLYIADTGHGRIRKVSKEGVITSVVGAGVGSFSEWPVSNIPLPIYPTDVLVDDMGNLYIADAGNHRIIKVEREGVSAPTGSIVINSSDALTKTTMATLTLSCTSCAQMQFSNDNITWSSLTPKADSVSWTLMTGVDGERTVYARFADVMGNLSTVVSSSIILDTQAPDAPVINVPVSDTYSNSMLQPTISGTAEAGGRVVVKNGSTVLGEVTATDGHWRLAPGVTTLTEGIHRFTASATDRAGNVGEMSIAVSFIVDITSPVITLAGGSLLTLAQGSVFVDPGSSVIDNLDPGLSSIVTGMVDTAVVGTYTLTYSAVDAAGNVATPLVRTVSVVDQTPPVITLTGAPFITVPQGGTYTEPGVSVVDNVDLGLSATVTGGVNSGVVGVYILTYTALDNAGNAAMAVTRTVNVVDQTAPVIVLAGANPMTVAQGAVFIDPGSIVSDNSDVGLSSRVTGEVDTAVTGVYMLTYNVSDAAGNEASPLTRIIHIVDQTAPVIILIGENPIYVAAGSVFTDPGSSATDFGGIALTPTVMGTVNTSVIGTYTLIYSISDAAGNASQVSRTVNVLDQTAPVITSPRSIVLMGDAALGGVPDSDVVITAFLTEASALDAVDGVIVPSHNAPGLFDNGTISTVVFTAIDAAGNIATAMVTVTVNDPEAIGNAAPAPSGTGLTIAQSEVLGLDPYANTIDVDGDGILDIDEVGDLANPSDLDNDGLLDIFEAGTKSQDASVAAGLFVGTGTVDISSPGESLANVSFMPAETGGPAGFSFPFGVIAYDTTASTTTQPKRVRLTFSSPLPENLSLFKVDYSGEYRELVNSSAQTYWVQINANVIELRLVDGDPMTDLDGVVNGVIVDPIAVASPQTSEELSKSDRSSSSGGCTINQSSSFDPVLLLMALFSFVYLVKHRGYSK